MNTMSNFFNNTESVVLSNEQLNTLINEVMSLLQEYNYHPTFDACAKIIDEWYNNKNNLIKLFMQHPNYNGKFQIAFDTDFDRNCDNNGIKYFCDFLLANMGFIVKKPEPKHLHFLSYAEAKSSRNKIDNIIDYVEYIERYNGYFCKVNGYNLSELKEQLIELECVVRSYDDAINNNVLYRDCNYNETYHYDDYNRYLTEVRNIKGVIARFRGYGSAIVDDELAERINAYLPALKIVSGQKTSRAMNKFCQLVGFDKLQDYNKEYAKYSDAINPLKIKRHTILSIHPIDYLTMSFGNSWASCHTIDKNNLRNNSGSTYQGCYSGGTLSYMLDSTSAVFYTVDSSYDGDKYEQQDKITRNMFHIGEDKVIQGRIYPQSTDGNNSTYKEYREIIQKIIADCLNVPNLWINKKGTDECEAVISSYGVHYRDYEHFDCCNVSYLKEDDLDINDKRIKVGHNPICPNCGRTHYWEECVECEACYNERVCCAECGCVLDEDDAHYIGGDYYCDDCVIYCDYHEEYEPNNCDHEYVDNYGYVCRSALENSGYFYYCEYHERYELDDCDHVYVDNYGDVCCSALEDSGSFYHCDSCERWVHECDFDTDNDCCADCAQNITNDEEDN